MPEQHEFPLPRFRVDASGRVRDLHEERRRAEDIQAFQEAVARAQAEEFGSNLIFFCLGLIGSGILLAVSYFAS